MRESAHKKKIVREKDNINRLLFVTRKDKIKFIGRKKCVQKKIKIY